MSKNILIPLLVVPFGLALTGGVVYMIHRHRYPPPAPAVVEPPKPELVVMVPIELSDRFLTNFVEAKDYFSNKLIKLTNCKGLLLAESEIGFGWALMDKEWHETEHKPQNVVVLIPHSMKEVAKMIVPSERYDVVGRFKDYNMSSKMVMVEAISITPVEQPPQKQQPKKAVEKPKQQQPAKPNVKKK